MVDTNSLGFQRFGLGQRAGHAVQNEAVCAVALSHAVGNDAEDQLIRDKRAFVHVLLGLFSQLRAVGHSLTEHVPGRNGGNGELLNKKLCLCSLSGAGSAQ